jgi:hypothetical protein
VAALRHLEEQPPHHALALLGHLGVVGAVELRRAARKPARREVLVDLAGHLVQAQLDHRQVRRGRLEVIGETGRGDPELGGGKRLEIAAEVDEHQVGLVTEERHARGRPRRPGLEIGEHGGGLVGQRPSFGRAQRLPRRPADAEHLVQD